MKTESLDVPRSRARRRTVIGVATKRVEDNRFLRGQGCFVDDVQLSHVLYARVLRSTHAHARIVGVDLSLARQVPGMVAIFTFADIAGVKPIPVRLNPYSTLDPFLQYPLASDRVRYVGEPVALIVAESRYQAEDAAEQIKIDYDPLPVVVDAEAEPVAALHDAAADNVASRFVMETGDVERAFATADHIVTAGFVTGRHGAVPLETRGLVASYDAGSERLRVWGPTKVTHFNRGVLANLLDMAESRIQLIEPDVGGGFGARGEFYPEDYLIPYAALRLGRPVKWFEDRLENLTACNHSRQQVYHMELALQRDGTMLGARLRLTNDHGAYIRTHGTVVPEMSAGMFPGPYLLRNYRCEIRCVLTNKTPTGTYRSPGHFEANTARERLLDVAAHELDLDAAELRMKNFIPPDAMPYEVGTHAQGHEIVYDSGDYPYALQEALRVCNYRTRKSRTRTNASSRLRGLGLTCFVETTGLGPFEGASVVIDTSGRAVVSTGAASVGQGLETTLAQIAADVLGLAPEQISVRHGDTDLLPYGIGSFASRGTVMAGSAVYEAAEKVREKLLKVAGQMLDVPVASLEQGTGLVRATGPDYRAVTFAQIAEYAGPLHSAPGEDPGVQATCYFKNDRTTYSHGVTVAEVEVDAQTGTVFPRHVWIVFDVGTVINPQTVIGQLQGGAVQGVGGALLEEFSYDGSGQPLNGSFMDYLQPAVANISALTLQRLDRSPSPSNPLGAKGAGECGIAGMGGAIANAVADALGDRGRYVDTLPLTPERVWGWLQAAVPLSSASACAF